LLLTRSVFAIPGIVALIVFILARPQEFILVLQRVPFLHLFTVLAVIGWIVDVRLRRLQPIAVPTLPWVIVFFAWAVVCTAVVAPEKLLGRGVALAISFCLYGVIAHGIQRFRTFQLVAGAIVATCLFITTICFHQGLAPKQCVAGELSTDGGIIGAPDGRRCEIAEQCLGPDSEPGKQYRCEHVGMADTFSIEERVRYRGELHDPNEVALTISAGALSFLIAFSLRRRSPLGLAFCVLGVLLVVATVLLTKSRGGLVSAMLVPGVYVVRRYGLWAVLPGVALAAAAVLLGGRSGHAADVSTELRYEAWATGLDLFKASPVFGVGSGQFVEHHFLTAHNSFVLMLGELGFIGLVLFSMVLYVSGKTLIVGLRELAHVPGSAVVQVWGMALLASLCGILFQINTLSFAYHSVLWMFLGLIGAWYSAIRHHAPAFRVPFGWLDVALVVGGCLTYALVILPMFLRYKGAL
jgi:hypothetical protein